MSRDEERRFSARLQTLIGADSVPGLAGLRAETVTCLGPGHEVTLAVEHAFEVRCDSRRTPLESLVVWAHLDRRAGGFAPIRARYRRQLLACGRPGDVDEAIALARRDTDPDARADLALALRDRVRSTGSGDDLAEAMALAGRGGKDRRRPEVLVEVLLALGRTDRHAATRALHEAGAMVDDDLPLARTLQAEALLLTGRAAEAARVARLAYALDACAEARPLMVAARAERAVTVALAALRQREAYFPGESHYVLEARKLVDDLC